MKFVCFADFNQLPKSADELFAAAAYTSVFLSRPWFENLVQTALDDAQSILLACVLDGDEVLAILPLMSSADGRLQALTHIYSSLYSPLLAAHDQHKTLACLIRGLNALPVYPLRLAPVAGDDENIVRWQRVSQANGCACHSHFRFYNWCHQVDGQAFSDYMAERPARVRNTIGRKQRKLEREHCAEIKLYTNSNVEQGVADFNAVYQASWKAAELYGNFIAGLAKQLAAVGWLRLAVLYINGRPAAAQFWFVVHGKASIFKLAYDAAWQRYSPGSILFSYLMKYVIDIDKVEEIDFLTGNDAYKQDWMSERRERLSLFCGKPRVTHGSISRLLELIKRFNSN